MTKREFVLEIATEELPAGPLYGAIEQLSVKVPELLRDARLEYGEVRVLGGPRRLVVQISELREHQRGGTGPDPASQGYPRQGRVRRRREPDAGRARVRSRQGCRRRRPAGRGRERRQLRVRRDRGDRRPCAEVLPALFSR